MDSLTQLSENIYTEAVHDLLYADIRNKMKEYLPDLGIKAVISRPLGWMGSSGILIIAPL